MITAVITPDIFLVWDAMSNRQTHRIILAALAIVFALIGACVYYFATNFMVSPPPHSVTDANDWPNTLREIVAKDNSLTDSVQVYEMRRLPDLKSVWLVKNHDAFIDSLIHTNKLAEITFDHPKLSELIESLPPEWEYFDIESSELHATAGFGSIHQEGIDLFVVACNRTSNESVILHEWVF